MKNAIKNKILIILFKIQMLLLSLIFLCMTIIRIKAPMDCSEFLTKLFHPIKDADNAMKYLMG